MPEVANTQVGYTQVSVSELLAKQEVINAKNSEISALSAKISVLESKLVDLKDNQKVIIKERGGFDGPRIIGTANLEEVKVDLAKQAEEKVRKELIELRATKATAQNEIELLKKIHEQEIELSEKEHQNTIEKIESKFKAKLNTKDDELNTVVKDSTAKIDDVVKVKDAAVMELNTTIQQLTAKLEDKAEQDKIKARVNGIEEVATALTNEMTKLQSKSIFGKIVNYVRRNSYYDNFAEKMNDLMYKIRSEVSTIGAIRYELPKSFNKYATYKVVSEGEIEGGRRCRYNPYGPAFFENSPRTITVTFEV